MAACGTGSPRNLILQESGRLCKLVVAVGGEVSQEQFKSARRTPILRGGPCSGRIATTALNCAPPAVTERGDRFLRFPGREAPSARSAFRESAQRDRRGASQPLGFVERTPPMGADYDSRGRSTYSTSVAVNGILRALRRAGHACAARSPACPCAFLHQPYFPPPDQLRRRCPVVATLAVVRRPPAWVHRSSSPRNRSI